MILIWKTLEILKIYHMRSISFFVFEYIENSDVWQNLKAY